MTNAKPRVSDEIDRYLQTGQTDPYFEAWDGSFFERATLAHRELRNALVHRVGEIAKGHAHEPAAVEDVISLTREKVAPMVHGLFPSAERAAVLTTLERSVVFVTSDNIASVLVDQSFDHSAWTLANMYLASVGAPLLSKDAPFLVGMSEGTTCFVSPDYFLEGDPFADFIVHEAAHIFHNCKRVTVGLRETRTKEWLLDIAFSKRETFAYACEAYSCILARAKSAADRQALAAEYGRAVRISEERVDAGEVAAIVAEAANARNGWKVIHARCAPPRRQQAGIANGVQSKPMTFGL